MNYYPQRKTIRFKNYDYSNPGLYFVTICTEDHQKLFGKIINNQMILNNAGRNVEHCWLDIQNHYPETILHEYIIMPNHIHGIIEITAGANHHSPVNEKCTNNHSPEKNDNMINDRVVFDKHTNDVNGYLKRAFEKRAFEKRAFDKRAYCDTPLRDGLRSPSKTIGSIVRGFKIGVMKWFRENMSEKYPIEKTIWQRNYHDQIIWNNELYKKITEYIKLNPEKWDK